MVWRCVGNAVQGPSFPSPWLSSGSQKHFFSSGMQLQMP